VKDAFGILVPHNGAEVPYLHKLDPGMETLRHTGLVGAEISVQSTPFGHMQILRDILNLCIFLEIFLRLLIKHLTTNYNTRRFGSWLCFRHQVKPYNLDGSIGKS
jgi:hypothetical protein